MDEIVCSSGLNLKHHTPDQARKPPSYFHGMWGCKEWLNTACCGWLIQTLIFHVTCPLMKIGSWGRAKERRTWQGGENGKDIHSRGGVSFYSGQYFDINLRLIGRIVAVLSWFCAPLITSLRHEAERGSPEQRREGENGRWKKGGWWRVGRRTRREVRRNTKRRKEDRKGKQVELLMLAIMFHPGQSISKTSNDIKYPLLSKTTYYPVLAECCAYVCIWGVAGATEAGVPDSICTA